VLQTIDYLNSEGLTPSLRTHLLFLGNASNVADLRYKITKKPVCFFMPVPLPEKLSNGVVKKKCY